MIVLQLLLYCLLFTAMVKIAVIGGAVNDMYPVYWTLLLN